MAAKKKATKNPYSKSQYYLVPQTGRVALLPRKKKGVARVLRRREVVALPRWKPDLKKLHLVVPTGAKVRIIRRKFIRKMVRGKLVRALDPIPENVADIAGPESSDVCPSVGTIPDDPVPQPGDTSQEWTVVDYYYQEIGAETTIILPDGDGDVGIRG